MNMPKGGRGLKAPYETCTVRIPADIREMVEELSNMYRASVLEGTEFKPSDTLSFDDALAEAKKILSQKRSAKLSIIKLLQVLYNRKVTERDLD